jgi:hypothetical protein
LDEWLRDVIEICVWRDGGSGIARFQMIHMSEGAKSHGQTGLVHRVSSTRRRALVFQGIAGARLLFSGLTPRGCCCRIALSGSGLLVAHRSFRCACSFNSVRVCAGLCSSSGRIEFPSSRFTLWHTRDGCARAVPGCYYRVVVSRPTARLVALLLLLFAALDLATPSVCGAEFEMPRLRASSDELCVESGKAPSTEHSPHQGCDCFCCCAHVSLPSMDMHMVALELQEFLSAGANCLATASRTLVLFHPPRA